MPRGQSETSAFEAELLVNQRGGKEAAKFEYEGEEAWIPASLILGADEDYTDPDNIGETFEIVIPTWKAKDICWE